MVVSPQCESWELNLGPLREQPVLLIVEPFLQARLGIPKSAMWFAINNYSQIVVRSERVVILSHSSLHSDCDI